MTSISLSSVSSQISSNIFSKLDTSNQGSIDATTLSKALGGSTDDQTSSEVSDLVSSMDTDGDSKITKSELSQGIENLFKQLQSASNQAGGAQGMPPPPPGGAGGPPPPRGGDEEDTGLTQDQMQEMASSTDDSKLSELLNNVASNFEAADTNGDGKVTQQEAMAYQQSQSSDNSNQASSSQQNNALEQVAKLIKTYGLDQDTSSSYLSTST
ncbi:EF-hand domain-containing protein [Methylophilus sp. QUAN]|uniref:EF-hand domain-containing protein n=1 Tax=Methylophilus sp. QUAN TaxID=2781020 RepID=UPI00188E91DD|nr:EF-hand domain-containing protein [Methylophilus sp. QUAN]MBF4990399.1 EF-hand domain-containing protein [Methylophilus sp. QUAN]